MILIFLNLKRRKGEGNYFMKKYKEILNRNNPLLNALALEYLLLNGRDNLLDEVYYQDLQNVIKDNDDKKSIITNRFSLESLKIARKMATLDTKELCEYIYDTEKAKKRNERSSYEER